MKKIFISILIIAVCCIPSVSSAQTSCSPVTSANYATCCGTAAGTTNSVDCKAYQNGYSNPQNSTQPTATQPTAANQCYPIVSFNYNACCTTYRSQNLTNCVAYDLKQSQTPGTIGSSGTPSTQVINGSNNSASTGIGSAPQAGSAELASCSAIRFLSLLDILIWIKCIIVVAIIPIIFALALMFFLWGVMKFIGASDSAKKEEGKKFIVSGLIGLFVMTSLWGIIKILGTTLGIQSTVPILQTTYLKK